MVAFQTNIAHLNFDSSIIKIKVDILKFSRFDWYTPRMVQLVVKEAARVAGIEKQVTPHRLRASVATILLDEEMPLDQVQKFLRHKQITTTQIYAETSLGNLASSYRRAFER